MVGRCRPHKSEESASLGRGVEKGEERNWGSGVGWESEDLKKFSGEGACGFQSPKVRLEPKMAPNLPHTIFHPSVSSEAPPENPWETWNIF